MHLGEHRRVLWDDCARAEIVQKCPFSRAKKNPKAKESHDQHQITFSTIQGGYRSLPKKTRVLRQIAPESSPESSAKSLSHKFFGVPFLSPTFVRNFWRVCSQFWLSVRNSVWGPFNRKSRGNPSLCWLGGGGVKGHKIVNKNFVNKLAFPKILGVPPYIISGRA